ncbi:hypothetical protein ACFPIJ_18485 [Dactylosporangium cerinum]|uniref:EAL domain-containing protein n=1 Tax=Dactylosporangium cerinum TaxID=1434730 RepID=A0ABV9VTS0_9ACTN
MDGTGGPGGPDRSTAGIIRGIGDVIDARAVTTVFQPIVRLDSWRRHRPEVVGYEALTRGPAGTPWEAPSSCSTRPARPGASPSSTGSALLQWIVPT